MTNQINKALIFAEKSHRGQSRKYSDIPYFIHPCRILVKLLKIGYSNENMLIAGLLHDCAEDCGISFEEISDKFGKEVSKLVEELTQADKLLPELKGRPRSERHQANLEKLNKVSQDAKILKLCDRLDNLEDTNLEHGECRGFLKRKYLQESWDIYNLLKDAHAGLANELKETIETLAGKLGVNLV